MFGFGIITRLIGCVLGNPSAEQLHAEKWNKHHRKTIKEKDTEISKYKDKQIELDKRETELNNRERDLDKRYDDLKQDEKDFEDRFNDAEILSRQEARDIIDENISNRKKCKVCKRKPCICDDEPERPILKGIIKTGLDILT
jgi:DNA repair exonuclease SbcCD ATPase subunit